MAGVREFSSSYRTRQSHRCSHSTQVFCSFHKFLPSRPHSGGPAGPCRAATVPPPSPPAPSPPAPTEPPAHAATAAPLWSRRAALLGLPFCTGALLRGSGWSALAAEPPLPLPLPRLPRPLRSTAWSVPSELTVLNDLEGPLKVYWINYDGDAELFGSLSPGSVFTVRTFESHVWRFVEATSGATVAEHVMAAGQQVVRVVTGTVAAAAAAAGSAGGGVGRPTASYTYTTASPAAQQQQPLAPRTGGGGGGAPSEGVAAAPAAPMEEQVAVSSRRVAVSSGSGGGFEGFDGLGNEESQYTLAQLREIKIYPGGGNVLLALPGLAAPLELALAGPEALSLVAATGSLEQRRPSTLGTWTRSLMASGVELRRVCITRMVDGVFYCRIVLSRPDSSLCSLDATPGDSLSLALQMGRPIYVANEVAKVHQSVADVFARRRRAMEAAAASGVLDEAAEAAADREAQDALDSITRGLPSAPRPVRAVEMDQHLDA